MLFGYSEGDEMKESEIWEEAAVTVQMYIDEHLSRKQV